MGNLFWCCFLELLFDFWGQNVFSSFFLLLAFRFPPRSLYSFILNRQEICPVFLTFVCLISFSSSQVPHFNRFLLLYIPPMSLKLLPFIWKPTFYTLCLCFAEAAGDSTNEASVLPAATRQALSTGGTRRPGREESICSSLSASPFLWAFPPSSVSFLTVAVPFCRCSWIHLQLFFQHQLNRYTLSSVCHLHETLLLGFKFQYCQLPFASHRP